MRLRTVVPSVESHMPIVDGNQHKACPGFFRKGDTMDNTTLIIVVLVVLLLLGGGLFGRGRWW
jgi:hypothetical protein